MGYEEDFILRLVKRVADVLARALGLAKAGDHEQAQQVLEQGVGAELGLPFALLLRLDPKTAVSMLGREKAAALADALRARSELFELAGRPTDATVAASHAGKIQALLG